MRSSTHTTIGKLIIGTVAVATISGCSGKSAETEANAVNNVESICTDKGATLSTLGPHVVCSFEDGGLCSVEAVKEGLCIEYGYKTRGYETDAQSYCAISGHEANLNTLQCELVTGEMCSFDAFWEGKCP